MPVICAEMLIGFEPISELRYVLRLSAPLPSGCFSVGCVTVDGAVAMVATEAAAAEAVTLAPVFAVDAITIFWLVERRRSVTVVIVIVSTT